MTRAFWGLVAATVALYLAMVLWSLPQLTVRAGGLAMFDLRPGGYDLATARAILAGLGAEGRGFYLDVQQRLDTLFPPLEALVFSLAFYRLYRPALAWPLVAVAVAAAGFDLMENAAVAEMLRAGPEAVTEAMVATASRWGRMKSAGVSLAVLALVPGLARAVWRRLRG